MPQKADRIPRPRELQTDSIALSSETQLRSRLKKWRVTKPSRQTRKKQQQNAQQETAANGDGQKETSTSPVETKPPAVPTSQPAPAQPPKELPASNPGWYDPNAWYAGQQGIVQVQQPKQEQPLPNAMPFDGQNVGNGWVSPRVQQQQQALSPHVDASQLRNGTSAMQQYPTVQTVPTPNPYEAHNPGTTTASHPNNAPMNTVPIMAPTYTSPAYSVPPQTGLSSPPITAPTAAATTTVQWPTGAEEIELDVNHGVSTMPEWFSATLQAVSQPPTLPYYAAGTAGPSMAGYPPQMQPLPQQNVMYPQSQPFGGLFQHGLEQFPGPMPWKRANAVDYDPQAAGGHARVDRQGRQRKPLADKKRKDVGIPATTTTSAAGMIPEPQPQYLPHEPHRMMPVNGFSYPVQEPVVQKPPGSGQ